MTVTANARVPAAERIAVRCVDSDVHPAPRSGELGQYLTEPWRSKYFGTHKVGDQIYYDAPDYAHSYAMRLDSFPPDGQFPCSDPELAFKQLIMEAGADIAILRTIGATPRQIMGIFMVQGTVIGVAGTVIGGVLGIIAAINVSTIAG